MLDPLLLAHLPGCPFCGRPVDMDDPDTLYPSGAAWVITNGLRHYVSHRDAPRGQWCYAMHCPESSGGCGAQISGDSQEEALEKWSRRVKRGFTS